MAAFSVSSPAFDDGDEIPVKHTCEGENVAPPLVWSEIPEGARALALIVDDPDAPKGTFTHWLAWNFDPQAGGLEEGASGPVEGKNDAGTTSYHGPCPPPGHGRHRYHFRLHALDAPLDLAAGASTDDVQRAIEDRLLDVALLVGGYER